MIYLGFFNSKHSSFSEETVIIGDMELTKDQYERMYGGSKEVESDYDSGISDIKYRWPNGIIPYKISTDFLQNETELILEIINEFNSIFKDHIKFK